MNRKHFLLYWIIAIIVLAAVTFFALPQLVSSLNGGTGFALDTMMSLYVAVYTLEATLLIAVLIYSLQTNASHREAVQNTKSAQRILHTELSAGLRANILSPCSGSADEISSHLPDLLLSYLPDVQDTLTPAQLHHLIMLVDVLSRKAQLSAEDSSDAVSYIQAHQHLFVAPEFLPAMHSVYADRFLFLSDYRCVLNAETQELLKVLSGEENPPSAQDVLRTVDGKRLLELDSQNHVKFYDENEALLCDAILDDDSLDGRGIESGWAKVSDYEGEFQDGLRHGTGCSYSVFHHHKLFDGTWEHGSPVTGTEYDIVVEKDKHADNEYFDLFPYWSEYSLVPSHIIDYLYQDEQEVDIHQLYVCDLIGDVNGESREESHVRPLLDFVRANDSDRLSTLENLLNQAQDS